jgi:hypothetical protein
VILMDYHEIIRVHYDVGGLESAASTAGKPGADVGLRAVEMGSKDGALPHYGGTSPSSAGRTGQATHRGIRLASNPLSRAWPRL